MNFVIRMPDETGTGANPYSYEPEQYTYMCTDGAIHVPAHIDLLDRNTCVLLAERAILDHGQNGEFGGMSRTRIAKEMYAHVVMYYDTSWVGDNVISEHAGVADINLGDGFVFEAAYETIWDLGVLSDVTYR
ncbi:MAG: hypothetical protein Q4D54_06190 [Eubacteriales bacterium]|nr:hypothetical protein [Lachnospiraceae bacterium]MDO5127319.1 hypothetical protein [Eubacteriales bacterium]